MIMGFTQSCFIRKSTKDLTKKVYSIGNRSGRGYWHSDINKPKDYHRKKYELCKEKGIRLITIFEDEWLEKEDIVKSKLFYICRFSQEKKIFARKCKVYKISQKQKKEFRTEKTFDLIVYWPVIKSRLRTVKKTHRIIR